jgi:hypothetical protein
MADAIERPISPSLPTPASLQSGISADIVVLCVAAAFFITMAADDVISWRANQVLFNFPGGVLFACMVLSAGYSILSNASLYGWPAWSDGFPGTWRAMFWATRQRPSWAKLPPAMRRPPIWMWLLCAVTAVGATVIVVGSLHAGIAKGGLRILPGSRYQVSTLDLNNAAWTQVSHVQYQAYTADFMRESALFVALPAVLLIANASYTLSLRRELVRMARHEQYRPVKRHRA